jgi:hypothetical protein
MISAEFVNLNLEKIIQTFSRAGNFQKDTCWLIEVGPSGSLETNHVTESSR